MSNKRRFNGTFALELRTGPTGQPFGVPHDAAMQALGSYNGGSMLFLGLGTGLGSVMIVDGIQEPMELGHLPYRKSTTKTTSAFAAWSGMERRSGANMSLTSLNT